MRRIVQPGPPERERIQWVEARGRAFTFTLEPGLLLLDAVREGFAREGFASGTVNMGSGALGPFAYVMPALSTNGANAAYYSQTFRPSGLTLLEAGAMTLGQRDGAAFFHCHALWTEADGRAGGGHILPEETVVAQSFSVEAYGIDGAVFTAEPDRETNFKLFGPVRSASTSRHTNSRAFALRLRPNQDFAGALEAFCVEQRIAGARARGGVGSIIGARFADGRVVEPFATEMLVKTGTVARGPGGVLEAELEVALVDYVGGLAEGRLQRCDNPVLMTMELVLEVLE